MDLFSLGRDISIANMVHHRQGWRPVGITGYICHLLFDTSTCEQVIFCTEIMYFRLSFYLLKRYTYQMLQKSPRLYTKTRSLHTESKQMPYPYKKTQHNISTTIATRYLRIKFVHTSRLYYLGLELVLGIHPELWRGCFWCLYLRTGQIQLCFGANLALEHWQFETPFSWSPAHDPHQASDTLFQQVLNHCATSKCLLLQ